MDLVFTHLEPGIIIILMGVALLAGIIDTLAGGGGLLTLPALLIAGVPPHMALGTNRFQASIGELTAAHHFYQKGAFEIEHMALGILFTAMGALTGAALVNALANELLEKLLPVLMVLITLYSISSKSLKRHHAVHGLMTSSVFMLSMGLAIGFYNGFFGPGTGSFWILAFVILLGSTLQQGSIHAKPLNLIGNLVSVGLFAWLGEINWLLGLLMGTGQITGAMIGSHLVLNKGAKLIRPVFIIVTISMAVSLIWRQYPG